MKAFTFFPPESGTSPSLTTLDAPNPGPGQLLIDVKAASVNTVDLKIAEGMRDIAPALPGPLGCDMAGVVASVGAGVSGFAVGDEVYGCVAGVAGHGGTYAEQVVADAALVAHKPGSLSFREAAALPLVAITAYEGLVDRARLKAGSHVLVHGGVGGVGHIAVQIAKALGAQVATTVSAAKADLAQQLGADGVIDYKREDPDAYVERLTGGTGFDLVFDTTGGSDLEKSFTAVRHSGDVVTIVSLFDADLTQMHLKGLSLHVVFMLLPMLTGVNRSRHGEILAEIARLVDAGQLRPLVDEEHFGLADVAQAHAKLREGRATGKLVIEIA